MPYIGRLGLMEAAREVWEMAQQYKTRDRGEFTIDRLLFAYFRGSGHAAARQSKIKSEKANRRIDFLIGGETSGTFVELVVRRNGAEWYAGQNSGELNGPNHHGSSAFCC